jgi:pilus assembly protein CpaE
MDVLLVGSADPVLTDMLGACRVRVTVAGPGEHGQSGAKSAGIVVIDHRQGRAIAPTLAAVRRHHPTAGVLLVLPTLDAMLILEAMRAGVSECIAHPFSIEDLRGAIDRITAARPVSHTSDVLAVVGAKGGVGATTVAVNVAAALAALKRGPTLLIDLHATYGDAAVFLGVEPRFSVVDAFENLHRLDAAVLKGLVTETSAGTDLLASSDRPAAVNPDGAQVRTLIELASAHYSFVVLDVPRSNAAILDAMDLAGSITVVANQELSAVRSAARISSAFQQRYGKNRVQILLTRYDDRAEIGQRDVERVVGMHVRHMLPNNYAAALNAQNAGRPLVLQGHTKLSLALTSFSRSLAGLPEEGGEAQRPGLFARIGRLGPTQAKGTTR